MAKTFVDILNKFGYLHLLHCLTAGCNVSIKDLIEAGQRELIAYLASDVTEDFPIQEFFFETCVSDDDDNDGNKITTPNDIVDINEEGYDGQQPVVELSLE